MKKTWTLTTMAAMVAAMAGGCAMWEQAKEGQQVTLVGANEVPAVNTRATGRASGARPPCDCARHISS